MFSINPFAELSSSISPSIMQTYVIVMVALVAGGTLFDIIHKKSAKYFFNNWRKSKEIGSNDVGAGEMVSIAVKTAVIDVATSGEFCNVKRRIAHLLTMYGFIAYVAATVCMVFYMHAPGSTLHAIAPQVWHIGALMVCIGGYWFWFFIRVDVFAEGNTPLRFVQADIFIVSLMVSTTLALVWSYLQSTGNAWTTVALGAYLLVTTILFVSIPWSKFSHMFFKPAAAMEKRVSYANGSRSNLPAPADKPATLGDPRRQPNNY